MPLTRNLYELDEVVSALQLCLYNGWSRAAFWLWELVVSNEDTLALDTLINAWLYWGGGLYAEQILSLPPDAWIDRYVLIREACCQAGSLNSARFLDETATMMSRPYMTPPPTNPIAAARRATRSAAFVASLDPAETISASDAAKFWISLDSACRQGRRTDAFWLLQAAQQILSADALWSALKIACRGGPPVTNIIDILRKSASAHPLQQILFQSAALLIHCTPTKDRAPMFTCTSKLFRMVHMRDWDVWNSMVGRRAARIHAIPEDALHAGTTRGQIAFKYTNIADVRDPIGLLSEGCAFWQKAIKEAGIEYDAEAGTISFPDDSVLETFYDRYFPDDLPDEWSKADQEKSHGRGSRTMAEDRSIHVREEPVSQFSWTCAIHVRAKKVKPGLRPTGQVRPLHIIKT